MCRNQPEPQVGVQDNCRRIPSETCTTWLKRTRNRTARVTVIMMIPMKSEIIEVRCYCKIVLKCGSQRQLNGLWLQIEIEQSGRGIIASARARNDSESVEISILVEIRPWESKTTTSYNWIYKRPQFRHDRSVDPYPEKWMRCKAIFVLHV